MRRCSFEYCSFHYALRSRIIAGTNAATVSAVVEVCVRINLTSVCVIQITIVKRGCTCGDFTGAVDASWSSIGDATSVAAGITVVDIVAAIDFASVAVIQLQSCQGAVHVAIWQFPPSKSGHHWRLDIGYRKFRNC